MTFVLRDVLDSSSCQGLCVTSVSNVEVFPAKEVGGIPQ